MTPQEFREARGLLGFTMAEMGRALGLGGRDPGASIRDYERGTTAISGPIAELTNAMLEGYVPQCRR